MQFVLSALASFAVLYGLISLAFALDYGVMLPRDLLSAPERKQIALIAVVFIIMAMVIFLLAPSVLDSEGKILGIAVVFVGPWLFFQELKWLRRMPDDRRENLTG